MCPGTRACKRAKQDSPGLGFALDKEFYGKPAPAEFKMGVSGCPNCCSDAWLKDLSFFGTDDGFKAVVGGKDGGTAKVGREFADGLTEEQAVTLARTVIAFYRENGQAPDAWVPRSSGSASTGSKKPSFDPGGVIRGRLMRPHRRTQPICPLFSRSNAVRARGRAVAVCRCAGLSRAGEGGKERAHDFAPLFRPGMHVRC